MSFCTSNNCVICLIFRFDPPTPLVLWVVFSGYLNIWQFFYWMSFWILPCVLNIGVTLYSLVLCSRRQLLNLYFWAFSPGLVLPSNGSIMVQMFPSSALWITKFPPLVSRNTDYALPCANFNDCSLWSSQVVLSPASVVSSPAHTSTRCRLKGEPLRSQVFLTVQLTSLWPPWAPLWCSFPGLPSGLSLQARPGAITGLNSFAPSLRDHCTALLDIQCLETVAVYTLSFWEFVFFFKWEGNSNSCSSIWAESKCKNHFWRQDFYYNVIWILLTKGSEDVTSYYYGLRVGKKIKKLSTSGDLSSNSCIALDKLPASFIPSFLTGTIELVISTS